MQSEKNRGAAQGAVERVKYTAAVVIYGTIGYFLRFVSWPSELVALCRGIIGSSFILLYLAVCGQKPDWKAVRANARWLIFSGICLGLNWVFLFVAYLRTTVAIASLCNYMAPAVVVVIAPLVLREPLEIRKLPCIAAALIGIVLVSGVLDGKGGEAVGVAFGLAAALCFVGIILCNRQLKEISPLDRSAVQLAVSAMTILPYVILHNRSVSIPMDTKSILIVLMLGVVHTGFAYCLYFSGMGRLPVQTVAILGYLEPVVSMLCSVFLLHEPLSVWGWLGAFLIIAAAVVSELMPVKRNTGHS